MMTIECLKPASGRGIIEQRFGESKAKGGLAASLQGRGCGGRGETDDRGQETGDGGTGDR